MGAGASAQVSKAIEEVTVEELAATLRDLSAEDAARIQGALKPQQTTQVGVSPMMRGSLIPEVGRYRMYIAKACPFAHRPRLVRLLLGLEDYVLTSEAKGQNAESFFFDPPEPEFGQTLLKDVYKATGQVDAVKFTVPFLVDRTTKKAFNTSESLDLCWEFLRLRGKIISSEEGSSSPKGGMTALPPPRLVIPQSEDEVIKVHALMQDISDNVTATPYKFLFTSDPAQKEVFRQKMYEQLVRFQTLIADGDLSLGGTLGGSKSMGGTLERNTDETTGRQLMVGLADTVLWPVLARYDNVYTRQFGLTGKTLRSDFPGLSDYVRRIHEMPGVAADANIALVVELYWKSVSLSRVAGNDPASEVPQVLEL